MNEVEEQIIDNARAYKNSQRSAYESPSGRYTSWFQHIHRHYQNSVLAGLNASREKLVDYWPCYVILEGREDRGLFSGTTQREYRGKYGSGYICITNDHARLFVFDQLSQAYSPFVQGAKGVAREFLTAVFGSPESYHFMALREDKTWTVPHRSISTAEIRPRYGVQALNLATKYGCFELLHVFSGDLPIILTALNMAVSGELTKIWTSPTTNRNSELLAKLEELRQAGVITQSEFETKRAMLSADSVR